MQVLVHTDHNIRANEGQVEHIEADLTHALERFGNHLTRVEVYLSDASANRSVGDDIRCVLEARPAGQDPVTVTHEAPSPAEAASGATHKLVTLLTHKFDRLTDKNKRDTIRGH